MNIDEFVEQYLEAIDAHDRDGAQALVTEHRTTAEKAADSLIFSNLFVGVTDSALPKAVNSLHIALNIAAQLDDELLQAAARTELAQCYLRLDDRHRALVSARDAEEVFRRHADESGMAMAAQVVGRVDESLQDETARRAFLLRHLRFTIEANLPKERERTEKELEQMTGQ